MEKQNSYTNNVYKDGNRIIVKKNKDTFNHKIDYEILSIFDFVPKLISETEEEIIGEYIDGELLLKPTDEDLVQLGKIIRTIHKSDLKFPKNNYRQRVNKYMQIVNSKNIRDEAIDSNYKEMKRLLSRMGRLNPLHNDLGSGNIIKDKKGKLGIIDGEYATMGDKHYDLAFYIESQRLTKKQEQIFLDSYNSQDDFQAGIDEGMPIYKTYVNGKTIIGAYSRDELPFNIDKLKEKIIKK